MLFFLLFSNVTLKHSVWQGNILDINANWTFALWGACSALRLSQVQAVLISNCNFTANRNKPVVQGTPAFSAAVKMHLCNALVLNSHFSDNLSYGTGGAAISVGTSCQMVLMMSSFTNNAAVVAANQQPAMHPSLVGGAVRLDPGSRVSVIACNFTANRALIGGAIHAASGKSCMITSTSALLDVDPGFFHTAGAGIGRLRWLTTSFPDLATRYMDTAEASAPSRFVGNAAVSGGAIAASDIGTLQFSSDDKKAKAYGDLPLTYMFNNTALSGGAVAVSRGSFYGTMSGIFIVLVHFDSNTAVPNQAAAAGLLQMLSLDWDSASSIASTVGCGPGGGGALCLVATQHSDLAVLGNCTFVNNLAAYGGGVYVTNNAELCGSNPDRCGRFTVLMTGSFQKWPSDISGAFKTSYVSSNNMCRFRNNTAVGGAGSAIYSDLPAGVTINCGPETPGGVPSVKPCPSWEGSVVSSRPPPAQPNPGNVTNTPLPAPSSGGVGNSSSSSRDGTSVVDDAGKATGLLLGGGADMVATSGLNLSVRPTTISQFTPDTDIVLWVASYDAFGHNLAYQYPSGSGSDNLTCEASTDSTNNAILYGQTSTEVTLTAATASQPAFTSLKLRLLPGSQQNVTITCTISQRQRVLPPATVMVSARSCLINEIISDTKDACMQCDSGFVALTPNTSCQACPASSTCNSLSIMGAAEAALLPGHLAGTVGPGIIVPNPGSWHSSPFATELYDCPNPASCSRDGRTHMLTAYQAQLVQNPRQYNATLWNSLMCADGYTGNFCGSCAPGYGSVAPARCVKCAGRGLGTLYYLLTTLLTLVPLLITLRASLKESQLILAEVDDEDLDSDVDEEIEFRSREFIAAQVIAEQDAQLAQSANHDDVRLEGLQCSTVSGPPCADCSTCKSVFCSRCLQQAGACMALVRARQVNSIGATAAVWLLLQPVYLQHTNPLAAFPPNDDIKVDDVRVGCGPSTLADPGDSCRHSSASGSPGPGLAITLPSRLLSGTIPSPSSPTLSHHTAMTVVPQNASHTKPPCQVQPSPLWASAGAETEQITMEPATAALPPSLHLQLPHRQPPSTQLPGLQLGDRVVSADVGLARQAAPEQVGPVRALSSRQPNQSAWPTHRGGVNELSEVRSHITSSSTCSTSTNSPHALGAVGPPSPWHGSNPSMLQQPREGPGAVAEAVEEECCTAPPPQQQHTWLGSSVGKLSRNKTSARAEIQAHGAASGVGSPYGASPAPHSSLRCNTGDGALEAPCKQRRVSTVMPDGSVSVTSHSLPPPLTLRRNMTFNKLTTPQRRGSSRTLYHSPLHSQDGSITSESSKTSKDAHSLAHLVSPIVK
ncbi:hypothetical protein QJQ45_016922, partial [Haematococcus lacustris]